MTEMTCQICGNPACELSYKFCDLHFQEAFFSLITDKEFDNAVERLNEEMGV